MRVKGLRYILPALVLALSITLTACGGSSTDDTTASSGSSSSSASPGADVTAAEAAIAPYVGKSSPSFPVTEPLKEKPSADTKISQLQFASPYGALLAQLFTQAGATAGVKVTTVKAGNSASSIRAAADSILSQSPKSMILPAAEPSLISGELKEMDAKGINVWSLGVMEPGKWGIDGSQFEDKQASLVGKLLADWTVAKHGAKANVVYYEIPEYSFNKYYKDAFLSEMKAVCPSCKARVASVPVAQIGTKAPSTVVSDLQANPDTNVVVLAASEIAIGLPAALRSAQIHVAIVGASGDPQAFQMVKNGEMETALSASAGIQAWTVMDMALRTAQGMELTAGEKKGFTPMQFITKADVTFDPKLGWASDPQFPKTFAKLWHAG